MMGETPLELHRRLRLERAAFQLASSDLPVTRIAFDAGYETHEAFARAFRQAHWASPSELRRRAPSLPTGQRFELAARSGVHFVPPGAGPPSVPCFDHGETTMNVDVVTMPELRLATLRHLGPYNRIAEAFSRLGEIPSRAGLTWQPAVYHDDPEATPAAELRSDAAFTLPEGVPSPRGAGDAAPGGLRVLRPRGPVHGAGGRVGAADGEWLPRSGRRLGAAHGYEVYGPMTEAEPRTGLYLPLG